MLIYIQSTLNGASTVKTELIKINLQFIDYDITLTGGITIFQECMEAIGEDMTSKDIIVMRLMFGFMIFMIGSYN